MVKRNVIEGSENKPEVVIRSTCRMCHGICQVLVHMDEDRVVKIIGDPNSPTSKGYICPKGAASPKLLYHPDRLTHPLLRSGERGENKWQPISWDKALDLMAHKLSKLKEDSGPEYFGMMQGTGRPYETFTGRFANAFGTPNFTAHSHVCYYPRQYASIATLGQLPVCDIYGFGGEIPRCIILWGCNITDIGAADGMCGSMLRRAIRNADKVIVVDPRRIRPAMKAHYWLQLRPGTDGALALAMLNVIITEGLVDYKFVEPYTTGFDELVDHIRPFTAQWASSITHVDAEIIRIAARTYATTKPACIQWGSAIDMNACNVQTARAILILRAITGNIDRPGGDVLWVPPAGIKLESIWMNREVAGPPLPLEIKNRRLDVQKYKLLNTIHPPAFWRSIVTGKPYRIRAMWIMGSNPLVTMTHSLEIEQALKLLEFTVVSDFFLTPTAQLADLVLPTATWLEQDDVALQQQIWCVLARKKLAQVGEVMDDREVILQLARRLGLSQTFPWKDLRDYFNWMLADTGMSFDEFTDCGIIIGNMKHYKYRTRGFNTPSKKFEIYSSVLERRGSSPLPVYREPPLTPVSAPELAEKYPLILMTGSKSLHFFHSEGRQIDSLRKANPDPIVELNPETANSLRICDGDWVWIETTESRVKMRARLCVGIAKNVVSAQHAWWFPEDEPPEYGWKRSSVNLLFGDMEYDPDTGSEHLRSVLCKIYPEKAL